MASNVMSLSDYEKQLQTNEANEPKSDVYSSTLNLPIHTTFNVNSSIM